MRTIINIVAALLAIFTTVAFAAPGRPTDEDIRKLAAERKIENAAKATIACSNIVIDTTKKTTTITNDKGETKVLPKVIPAGTQYVYICQIGEFNPMNNQIIAVKHRDSGKLAILVNGK